MPPDPDPGDGARARSVDPWQDFKMWLRVRFSKSEYFAARKEFDAALAVERQQSTAQQEGWTLHTLAQHLGWGERMSDEEVWSFIAERERLLRVAQQLLHTHKSDAPTAEAAIRERVAVLTQAEADVASLTQQLEDARKAHDAAFQMTQESQQRYNALWEERGKEILAFQAQVTAQAAEIAMLRSDRKEALQLISQYGFGEAKHKVDALESHLADVRQQLDQQLKISGDYWQVIETQRQELITLRAEIACYSNGK